MQLLVHRINSNLNGYASAEIDGNSIKLTSGNKTTAANVYVRPDAIGISDLGGEKPTSSLNYSNGTNAGIPSGYFSGGDDGINAHPGDPESHGRPATTATYGPKNISNALVPSGFTVDGNAIEFTDSSDPPAWNSERRVYTVGKNATFKDYSIGRFKMSLSNGSLSLSANSAGSWGNNLRVEDGYRYVESISMFPSMMMLRT